MKNQNQLNSKRSILFAKASLFLISLAILLAISSHSQGLDSDHNHQLKEYLKQKSIESERGEREAQRSKLLYFDKLDQYGSMDSYLEAISNQNNAICTDTDLSEWELIGPYYYHDGDAQWNGFVSKVSPDPTQIDTDFPEENCLLGLPTGGVFKFDNNNQVWESKTDELEQYGMGISEYLRHSTQPSKLLAATGVKWSNTQSYGNSFGLMQSDDNGETWTDFGFLFPGFVSGKTNIRGIYYAKDDLGNVLDINTNFYCISSNDGQPFQLWEWCSPNWVDRTPQEYIDLYNTTQPFLQLADFTSTAHSMILTASYPYGAQGAVFYGTHSGGCSSVSWVDYTATMETYGINMYTNQILGVSDAKGDIIFARISYGNKLFQSTDGGFSWSEVLTNSGLNARSLIDMEYSENTGLVYLAGISMRVYDTSTGIVKTISTSNQHPDIRDMKIAGINSDGQEIVFMANDGGISKLVYDPIVASGNLGASGAIVVTPVSGTSMPVQQVWGIDVKQSIDEELACGIMHGNSMGLVNGQWCKFGGGDGGDVILNDNDNLTLYYNQNAGIYKLTNGICNTGSAFVASTNVQQSGRPKKLHPSDNCLLYFGNKQADPGLAAQLLIKSECAPILTTEVRDLDNNVTTIDGSTPTEFLEEIGAISLTEDAPLQIILGTNSSKSPGSSGLLLKSVDHGINWVDLSHAPTTWSGGIDPLTDVIGWRAIGDIEVSPYDKDLIFVSTRNTSDERKVLISYDGGMSFADYSTGLPPLPINKLIMQYDTDNRIFVGTDVGVFYRESSMTEWECFSHDLPRTWVTDLDINYCTNTLYAGTYGRSIYKTSLDVLNRVERERLITSDESWFHDRMILSDVRIQSGATLSINSSVIKLAEGVRIIVEPGAGLDVVDSELKSLCEDSCWDGIVVEGNSSSPQRPWGNDQGIAYIEGSVISNAKNALNSYGINEASQSINYNEMGGEIYALNTQFINNKRSVQFLSFDNFDNLDQPISNASSFVNCSFVVNDDLYSCGSNTPHVTLSSVDEVLFKGCEFRDDRTSLGSISDYRTGILAVNATVRVLKDEDSSTPCSFERLYNGIKIENVGSEGHFITEIRDSEFFENRFGINVINSNTALHITNNSIYLGHPEAIEAVGIILELSSGFTLEENLCVRNPDFVNFTTGFAIYSTYNDNNPYLTGPYPHNIVYNNKSMGNDQGFIAVGTNRSIDGNGLEFLCNENVQNEIDFRFDGCIKQHQGSEISPAGNTFSSGGVPIQIIPSADFCMIYHLGPDIPNAPDPNDYINFILNIQLTDQLSNCSYTCPTDFNFDGVTDGEDFSIFLGNYDLTCDIFSCLTDLNFDGITNGVDFSIFLGNYGLDCN